MTLPKRWKFFMISRIMIKYSWWKDMFLISFLFIFCCNGMAVLDYNSIDDEIKYRSVFFFISTNYSKVSIINHKRPSICESFWIFLFGIVMVIFFLFLLLLSLEASLVSRSSSLIKYILYILTKCIKSDFKVISVPSF